MYDSNGCTVALVVRGAGDVPAVDDGPVDDIDEARQLVATDPVVAKGEMVAEFHKYYGTAALMLLRDLYEKVAQKPM